MFDEKTGITSVNLYNYKEDNNEIKITRKVIALRQHDKVVVSDDGNFLQVRIAGVYQNGKDGEWCELSEYGFKSISAVLASIIKNNGEEYLETKLFKWEH